MDSPKYLDLVEEIQQLVGNINGKYSTVTHSPIYYVQKKSPAWEESWALFSIADCCLITSLRDGMNLTCHEFAVSEIFFYCSFFITKKKKKKKKLSRFQRQKIVPSF